MNSEAGADRFAAAQTAQQLLASLAHVDADHALLNEIIRSGPNVGSTASTDGRHRLGNLPATFACQQLGIATDHLITWHRLLVSGYLPGFAHMSLLRSAFEGSATSRWLFDSETDSSERVRRSALLQLEDHRDRRSFERGLGVPDSFFSGAAKSGANRYEEHLKEMTAAGLALRPKKPSATQLVAEFGPGAWVYQMTSGFAHRRSWALLFSEVNQLPEDIGISGSRGVEIAANERWAVRLTSLAVRETQKALRELEAYFGRSRD